ncbi:MAG: DUF1214 domain-containing protein [Pseudomonadales bacterium]|nr:DUF1214 domain-containing protein [Pseudomonadales bacterium]MDG1442992.1 DUF1214 domain-containing protein [Pseudomonadales bacterium]
MTNTSLPDDISAAAEAYIWGFPLVSVHRTRSLLCSKTDTGTLNHIDDLATPNDRAIVVPNNDTLYSSGWYDLQRGDLTIDVPAMDHPDRYWNVMILDAYTHVAYVCRRHHGVAGTRVRVTFDPTTPPANDDGDIVTIGTTTAWVIIRVLVESPADIAQARSLQHGITVTAPSSHPNKRTERAGRATAIGKAGADFYSELKRYTEIDPPAPWHPQLSAAAKAIINDPSRVSSKALAAGVEEGEKRIVGGNKSGNVHKNGWTTGRGATGSGEDILKRAVGAKFGLGGHQAIENRSYIAQQDSAGNRLNGSQALQLKFQANALPPCNAFWSLTAYGTDMYLVENEIDRWSLSDRTPGLVYDEDGGLTILISSARPADIANWLPVPEGHYMMGMRVYEGHEGVIECQWFPPSLVAL